MTDTGEQMANGARPQLDELESLRGLAALLVVLFHVPLWHPALELDLIRNAYLMVELFFVLSGFVIWTAYGDRIRSGRALLRFQFLRFARLYPVHLLFLLVFVGIEGIKLLAASRLGIAAPAGGPASGNTGQNFFENLLLLHAVLPDRPLSFNFPSWSISVEFWTYLVFGLLTLMFGRSKDIAFAGVTALALWALATGNAQDHEPLLKCLAGFFLGCLVAQTARHRPAMRSGPVFPVLLLLLGFLAFKPDGRYDILVFPLSAALVLSLVRSPQGATARALRLRPLVWLGSISYSLYMAHASVLWAANQGVRLWSDLPDWTGPDGRDIPQLPLAPALLAVALSVGAAILLAAMVHQLVERPLRERSRRTQVFSAEPSRASGRLEQDAGR